MRPGRNQNQAEAAEKTTLIFTANMTFIYVTLFIFFRYIYIYIPLHVKYFRKVVSQTQKHGRQAPAAFEDAALRVGLISGY